MLKTEQLKSYLNQYQSLAYHSDPKLKDTTNQILQWQHQRMKTMHPNLFKDAKLKKMIDFFCSHLYNFEALHVLVEQLELALEQKIKLDRWLPEQVLDTILLGFELALSSLKLDMEIAQSLNAHQLSVSDENLLSLPASLIASELRYEQLQQLATLGTKLDRLTHSFMIRSALKLARGKIIERGFEEIYLYIEQGFKAMRSQRNNKRFFIKLSKQDQIFLDYLLQSQPKDLNIYYDTVSAKMLKIMPNNSLMR